MSVSRRKYAEIVAFLKSTIKNEKAPLRLRYACATRLDDIFARHQQAEQRAIRKKAGQDAVIPAEETTENTELQKELSAEELEEQRVRKIFDDVLGQTPSLG